MAQVELIQLVDSMERPLTEQQAAPAIRRFIENKNREEEVDAEVKRLRAATKIEYLNDFAKKKLAANTPLPTDEGRPAVAPVVRTVAKQGPVSSPKEEDYIERGVSGLGK
jgi:hypothetical protein